MSTYKLGDVTGNLFIVATPVGISAKPLSDNASSCEVHLMGLLVSM
jgi:hypothetical protein